MNETQKLREALQIAANALTLISKLAGKSVHPNGDLTYMGTFDAVKSYATSHANIATQALSTTAPDQDDLIRSAERHLSLFDGQETFSRADMLNAFYQGSKHQTAAPAVPQGLDEYLARIDCYAKGIKRRLDGKEYFGEDAPTGLKNGPIYSAAERADSAAERADFIVNCVRDMRAMLAATTAPAPAQESIKDRSERQFMERMEANYDKLTEFSRTVESFTQDYQRLYSSYKSYRDAIHDVMKERDILKEQVTKPALGRPNEVQ